jgi:hypothetical protein
LPSTYVIDRAGIVRTAQAGSFDENSFDAAVAPLLAEPAPGGAALPAQQVAGGGVSLAR